ncbi:rhodanese-like domain-containing protein [Jiulongibacter sediminis]|jgi:glyoxylase-like metal-dependent hydrolase (beta-lactamase superfamily II)/rhodanese-related sulfurtransferase|uniref:MBL fold metallo-hydrolase n=1 Tax=Jiulongibacter sediminis TaxID=1605367 RepID=UPI0026EE1122|nr:rhodanese-like domain-containing protein [Jiulongibacter sediminis]
MKVEQIYTGCLAEAAYYIESDGEAAIIDPLRESAPYIERAKKDNAKIKYVLETHFHADFVSGHIDLSNKTGATIVFGPTAEPGYAAHIAEDGEILKLGKVKIKVLHTPGHTMESTSFLLIDENGIENGVFTGDALFIGDVGRPDLAVKSDLSQEDLAGHLYDSLQNKILPLPDSVIIYPGHGAGSACGKNMSKETTDTLGNQRKFNYALQAKTKEEFVASVLDGLVAPPQYFPKNAVMNKMGYQSIDDVLDRGLQALSPEAFEAAAEETEALMLDLRDPDKFATGFIPNSINIGLDGTFATWVGTLIPDLQQKILLIAEPGTEEEAVTRLSRVGYDHTIGFLDGGIDSWKKSGKDIDSIETIDANDFAKLFYSNENLDVLDIRRKSEYDSEHIIGIENFPLDFINQHMAELKNNKKYYLHCAGGYRSMIMASILKSRGFDEVVNINGGFAALKGTNKFDLTQYVEPKTML